jgi:hypothetical protein
MVNRGIIRAYYEFSILIPCKIFKIAYIATNPALSLVTVKQCLEGDIFIYLPVPELADALVFMRRINGAFPTLIRTVLPFSIKNRIAHGTKRNSRLFKRLFPKSLYLFGFFLFPFLYPQ